MATKIFRCNHCGNIITHLTNSGVPVVCCGEKMVELVPNTTDAATEKHVPDVKVDGKKVIVTVGSVEHPMVEEHFIEWILVETKEGVQVKWLKAGQKPTHEFVLSEGDELVAVYEYCNLHGLWVKNF
ncbi:MAG: desulfoferrodoxin [Bacteroidales bacterium]|jgi:superoxide reductase|nr:desulfoferrodoxin [Bacteroidales bacterium]MBO7320905.1 desulfoferrodoxin [Bacteroidales bacterium]